MPRTARLEPLPPTPMGRPPGRTPATRGRSRSHRGGTAEVEDRRIGVTVRWCCRLTQAFTSGATRPAVDTINCAKRVLRDRKSTRLNSSHGYISYAVFCLKKKKKKTKCYN